MKRGLMKNEWAGRVLIGALAALIVAFGICCFLAGPEFGMDGQHGMSPDYCAGLVMLATILFALLGLAAVGRLLADTAPLVYAVSLVCVDPPPKSPSFS